MGKIFINILPTFNISINIEKDEIVIKRKSMAFGSFIRGILLDEPESYKKLVSENKISVCEISDDKDLKIEMIKLLGLHSDEYFNTNGSLSISDFFNKYLILDYFKGMFLDSFGVETIGEILKKVINMYHDDVDIDMSNLKNRRIVCNEYLIQPIYEMYIRLLFGAVDKSEKQAFLPTMNARVLLTTGFQKLMHGGTYFNTSLPYISPIVNKISQDIYIINDGRIPKSWTANNPSGIGKLCPISVSAAGMGSNLVFTTDTRINYYGRIE